MGICCSNRKRTACVNQHFELLMTTLTKPSSSKCDFTWDPRPNPSVCYYSVSSFWLLPLSSYLTELPLPALLSLSRDPRKTTANTKEFCHNTGIWIISLTPVTEGVELQRVYVIWMVFPSDVTKKKWYHEKRHLPKRWKWCGFGGIVCPHLRKNLLSCKGLGNWSITATESWPEG